MLKTLNKILFFLIPFIFFSYTASSIEKKDFLINGNKTISIETILNILDFSPSQTIDIETINVFQKKLYASNFFAKVDILISSSSSKKKIVKINLEENPIVEYLFIQGIKKKSLEDDVRKKLSLKESNFFSEFLLKSDSSSISSFLASLGYLGNIVNYQVKEIENNRVNIFFEIDPGEKISIKNIFFIGDKKFSSSKLSDIITSTSNNWFSFFSSSSIPTPDRIAYDVSLLKNFYLNRGYYEVQISNGSLEIVNEKFANLNFVINSGQKFFLKKTNFTNSSLSLKKKKDLNFVSNIIKKVNNIPYNYKILNNYQKKIQEYFDINNIGSTISYNLKKISSNELQARYFVDEVLAKKIISNIIIKGNSITEEKVIRNNLTFAEGDVYSAYNIRNSKDKLNALGFFKNININTQNIINSQNIDVIISLNEVSTGEISAGAGFGSTGASISFGVQEKNFYGQGLLADITLNLGTEQTIGQISISNPDFANTGNTLNNSFFITKSYYENAGYENKIFGSDASYGFEILKDIDLTLGVGIDHDSIDVEEKASSLIKKRDGNFLTNKIFYSVVNDKRNKKFQTTQGYTVGLSQTFATPISKIPYLSNQIFGSYYKELHENFQGTIRYNINSINAISANKDVKLSDRKFLSDNYLRGFTYRNYGPKVDGDYIGGNYSYASTFASSFPNGFPDKWNATSNLFLDVGNIWGVDFSGATDASKIRSSLGIGFSWRSPIGPLSISYAEPLSKHKSDKTEKFNFKLGGMF
jgi:outer membrane protein insertion porin family